jgi:hypothetical protein
LRQLNRRSLKKANLGPYLVMPSLSPRLPEERAEVSTGPRVQRSRIDGSKYGLLSLLVRDTNHQEVLKLFGIAGSSRPD